MSDIRYKWNDGLNSVQISSDVSLPQFKVLGHRQKTIEASLSTGTHFLLIQSFSQYSSKYFFAHQNALFNHNIPKICNSLDFYEIYG